MNHFYIDKEYRLPRALVIVTVALCIIPFLLQLSGVDFGNAVHSATTEVMTTDDMFYQLSGGFTHALLEWSAFTAAIFVVLLAFSHYSITNDITTPIIGVALFCAGAMDAFHTLAATRLITVVAENKDLIPFTWALSRVFNGIIMLLGVGIFLRANKVKPEKGLIFIVLTSLVFAAIGYFLIYMSATSHNLPQTQFPDSFIRRPYDIIPLVLFIFAGLVVYPLFAKRYPSIFASALLLSALPEVAVEIHMAFGSQRLFDSDFNVAHFLKIIAYVIPLAGLVMDYVQTYKTQVSHLQQLQAAHEKLNIKALEINKANKSLEQSNSELEKFAYIASHDLQEPLRKIQAFGDRLHSSLDKSANEKSLDYINRMQIAATRMRSLIDDLLKFSRIGNLEYQLKPVKLNRVLSNVTDDLQLSISEKHARISFDTLPEVYGEEKQLYQVFLNLISNSLKFSKPEVTPEIIVSCQRIQHDDKAYWQINIQDNGIGFEQEYENKIFEVFQRLHGRSQYEGTGIGLAICKKIIEKHHGTITVQSKLGMGTCFILLLEIRNENET